MSISINNLLSQFRVQLPILTTLPEVVPAGAEFYYNGTKWRGLGAGETSLPEGTPWPVKGYKELSLYFSGNGSFIGVTKVVNNELGVIINTDDTFDINQGVAILIQSSQIQNYDSNVVFGNSISYLNIDDEVVENAYAEGIIDGVAIIFESAETFSRGVIASAIPITIRIYPPQP